MSEKDQTQPVRGRPPAAFLERFATYSGAGTPVFLTAPADASEEVLSNVIFNPTDKDIASAKQSFAPQVSGMSDLKSFAAGFWQFPDAHQAMSDKDWATFTDFVKPIFSDAQTLFWSPIPTSLGANLPADFPPELVAMRLSVIDAHPKPENLRTKIQLAELEMASTFQRPVNTDLFTKDQLTPTWHQKLAELDLAEMMKSNTDLAEEAGKLKQKIEQERRSGDDHANRDLPNLDIQRLAVMNQLQEEGHTIRQILQREQSRKPKVSLNPFDTALGEFESDDSASISN